MTTRGRRVGASCGTGLAILPGGGDVARPAAEVRIARALGRERAVLGEEQGALAQPEHATPHLGVDEGPDRGRRREAVDAGADRSERVGPQRGLLTREVGPGQRRERVDETCTFGEHALHPLSGAVLAVRPGFMGREAFVFGG